jgi:hypothetical protein
MAAEEVVKLLPGTEEELRPLVDALQHRPYAEPSEILDKATKVCSPECRNYLEATNRVGGEAVRESNKECAEVTTMLYQRYREQYEDQVQKLAKLVAKLEAQLKDQIALDPNVEELHRLRQERANLVEQVNRLGRDRAMQDEMIYQLKKQKKYIE